MSEPAAEDALGSCEDTIGIVSDELLADLNECASRPCDEIEACLNLAFITSIPLGTLLELEDGGEPSPAVIAELIPILIAFGQLGLDDSGAGDFFGGMDGTAGGPQN